MTDTPVAAFVHALDKYRTAEDERGRQFATREPADLNAADAEVRRALKALINDL